MSSAQDPKPSDGEWRSYGNDSEGTKYSPLADIRRENVDRLQPAWSYQTGDLLYRSDSSGAQPAHEATPLFVDGTLFVSTPFGRVIALDPERGTSRWTFDPHIDLHADYSDFANRGVSTWLDQSRPEQAPCRRRIFDATIDARLIALDAATGVPCRDFGTHGEVNLLKGLLQGPEYPGEYEETSPPAIIDDLVVVGAGIADNNRVHAPSGEVRAFDVRTGALRWTWYPIPRHAGDVGADTWKAGSASRTGAANAWSIIAVDPARKMVFVPTGSASPDYYGGLRLGDNRFADSIVALRADTGQMVWSFQTVHHDLWDYDVASTPVLYSMRRGSETIPAIAVGSKTGHLFLLRRDTGEPLFGVDERPVPASDVPGEAAAPTQPFPILPRPLVPQRLTPGDAWGIDDADRTWCRERIRSLRSDGIFTPPSLGGSIVIPGNIGGMQWGGGAFDPERSLFVVPTNRLPAVVRLIPHAQFEREKRAHPDVQTTEQKGAPYSMSREFLTSPHGLPCSPPPWGALTAIDVTTGLVRWETPFGVVPALKDHAEAEQWGSTNMGGPLATAGGLVFIGASTDGYLRAFDTDTGRELWRAKLPTAARACPMTYRTKSGVQYVVIVAGGRNNTTAPQGDWVLAFRLPPA